MPASVTLQNIRKSFGPTPIIKGVDLRVEPSEFVVFVGPSGCGKSTMLRIIAGLETPDDGEVRFDDVRVNELSPAERKVGMVFQSYALYPPMTVAENIGFALKLQRMDRAERERRVDEALDILQLSDLRASRPAQLSGGQRQRVAIGRAIVRRPNVFLFDEPLSNLDTALRVQMRLEISRLHQRLMNTVIYVTHDQVEAMTLADRIVVFEGGHIQQVGPPLELYNRPANRFVAGFLGSPKMGFIDARVAASGGCRARLTLPGASRTLDIDDLAEPVREGDGLTVGIPPEDLVLSAADGATIAGPVLQVERLGAETFAFVDAGAEEPVAVRIRRPASVHPGEIIGATIPPGKVHLFSNEGLTLPRVVTDHAPSSEK